MQKPRITNAEGKPKQRDVFLIGIYPEDENQRLSSLHVCFINGSIVTHHVYLRVPLCSGEADDFSGFSLLSSFHGLLDTSTGREAEVRTELLR